MAKVTASVMLDEMSGKAGSVVSVKTGQATELQQLPVTTVTLALASGKKKAA